MIPFHHFVALLEGHFFPKWHQVLVLNQLNTKVYFIQTLQHIHVCTYIHT